MSTGTLFDMGGSPSAAPKAPAAPRGGRRKAAAITPTSQPRASAIHPAATTEPAPAMQIPSDAPAEAPAVEPDAPPAVAGPAPIRGPVPLPPFNPDDASFYAQSYRLLRASPAELAEIDARHRRSGYCRPPSPDALAGAISACAPRERPAGPWVTCECGSEMLADHMAEHLAIAAHAASAKPDADGKLPFSLHNVFMARRVAGAP